MSLPNVFTPKGTVSIAATTTSTNIALTPTRNQRVFNSGSALVFLAFGSSGVTATTTGLPMPSGVVEMFDVGNATYAAAITSAGTATPYFTGGEGF